MELKEKIAGNKPFPGIVHDTPGGGIVVSTFDSIINWARSIPYGHYLLQQAVAVLK